MKRYHEHYDLNFLQRMRLHREERKYETLYYVATSADDLVSNFEKVDNGKHNLIDIFLERESKAFLIDFK